MEKEMVTVGVNGNTVFSKLITQRPWQQDTALTAKALRVGAFVVVHVPTNNGFVANWVQVALDRGFANNEPVAAIAPTASYTHSDEALKHLAAAKRAGPIRRHPSRSGRAPWIRQHTVSGSRHWVAPRSARHRWRLRLR